MAKARATKRTSRKTSNKPAESKGTCFAIMPFGGWFDDYYSTIFVPAIVQAGLEPCRADDLYRPSTIVADIWNYTNRAKLVIADLSGKNPNVFYELGLAHALAKPAILVVESMDDVPFDLRALRVLQYNKNDPNWGAILHDKIVKAIGEVLADPLQSVPTTFLETKRQRGTPVITEQEKELLSIRQDLDLLRREIRVGVRTPREVIRSPEEALEEIQRLLRRGYPTGLIRRRLAERGVPPEWLDSELDKRLLTLRRPTTISPEPKAPTPTDVATREPSGGASASSTREAGFVSGAGEPRGDKPRTAGKRDTKRRA